MTYFPDLHSYLHQSSLLIQAYPKTTRITTKYSLPRKAKSTSTPTQDGQTEPAPAKREPAATLTLKTFHPESGICLKYQTDKAAEVGRLLTGLGRLAKGEVIELPQSDSTDTAVGTGVEVGSGQVLTGTDKMDLDSTTTPEAKSAAQMTSAGQQQGGGGKKKKKGKK